eukprot:NODE_2172_length_619_cov_201.621053_g1712_i0.p1 GENE.NODE_2172_length_619_cov_201.621053_g1712_i0~~NODE_2172_length_619_cov_201.621053_g1712_i0.p1  ORF type:complete len:168 (+),score=11.94 NODE_2172_length_619_cov_201.621053_g1712_i0:68-505(+)
MAVVKREWKPVDVSSRIESFDQEWPCDIHRDITFINGPSDSKFKAFVRVSRIRSFIYEIFDTRGVVATQEEQRRRMLAQSNKLWHIPHQTPIRTAAERRMNRTRLTAKGYINGPGDLRHVNPVAWLPFVGITLIWLYRWPEPAPY